MQYYFAPLEGITTYIYRNAFQHYFGGPDKYFAPFIGNKKMSQHELNDILPEHNQSITLIPQIMANRSEDFLLIAKSLMEFGYSSVNLNLGCPSGTVVSKHRGAGLLAYPDELDRFLYEIYEKSPVDISIKTRIGIMEEEEWLPLLKIYQKYPVNELIIHPRLRQDFYNKPTHPQAFQTAYELLKNTSEAPALVFNGDIDSVAALELLLSQLPFIQTAMIGRGVLKDPWLFLKLKGDALPLKSALCGFHDEILYGYQETMSGDTPVLYKMKELWTYMGASFPDEPKLIKLVHKCKSLRDYKLMISACLS